MKHAVVFISRVAHLTDVDYVEGKLLGTQSAG